MSPIELLIEDTNTNNRKESSIINSDIQSNVSDNNNSILGNQNLLTAPPLINHLQEKNTKNLLKMSSYEPSLKPSTTLSKDHRDAGGGENIDSKHKFNNFDTNSDDHEVLINSKKQNNPTLSNFYQNQQISEETAGEDSTFIQTNFDENVSSSSLSTSSMSPMSDSVLSQSKNNRTSDNDKDCFQETELQQTDETGNLITSSLTEIRPDENENDAYNYNENKEIETTLSNGKISSNFNNKSAITSPPNTLALHTNLNNVMLSNADTVIESSSSYFEPDSYSNSLNHSQSFIPDSTSSSSPSGQQIVSGKSQSIEYNNTGYPIISPIPITSLLAPQPLHRQHHQAPSYMYPSTQFSNQLNQAYLNNNYQSYGYNTTPHQYLVQHIPTISQQITSNHAQTIVAPQADIASSSSASTPTPKQTLIAPSSTSSSSNIITTNQQNNLTPTNSSTIYVHIESGHVFRVQLGDEIREILGPATVKMVSNDGAQPVPIQLTTPSPGQLVQQIIDENGVLIHLILSSQQQTLGSLNTPSALNNIQHATDIANIAPNLVKSSANSMQSCSILCYRSFILKIK